MPTRMRAMPAKKTATFSWGGPASVAGLNLWVKADAGTWQLSTLATPAVADGDPIGGWTDQSGQAHSPIQATTTKRGTLKLNIRNGLPVVRFDGLTQYLATTGFAINEPLVRFIAGQLRVVAPHNFTADGVMGSLDGSNYLFIDSAGTTVYTTGGGNNGVTPNVVLDQWGVVTTIFGIPANQLRYNRVPVPLTGFNGTGNAANGLVFGAYASGGTRCTALDVGEILQYQGPLSIGDISLIEQYLKNRWGTP